MPILCAQTPNTGMLTILAEILHKIYIHIIYFIVNYFTIKNLYLVGPIVDGSPMGPNNDATDFQMNYRILNSMDETEGNKLCIRTLNT